MKSLLPYSFRLLTLAFLLSFSSLSARPCAASTVPNGSLFLSAGLPGEETKEFDFYVSPNPSTGNTLTLRFTNVVNGNAQVKIYNLIGREMFSTGISVTATGEFVATIDLPRDLVPGTYLLTVTLNNSICTKRFIVR